MYNSQTLIYNIKLQAKNKGVLIRDMLFDCGLSINAISQISDKKGLSSFSLARIADYLDCSVDYLLGRTDTPGQKKEASIHPLSGQTDAPVVVMGHGGTGGIHVVSSPNPEKLAELYDTLSNFNDDQLQLVIDYAKYLYKSGK